MYYNNTYNYNDYKYYYKLRSGFMVKEIRQTSIAQIGTGFGAIIPIDFIRILKLQAKDKVEVKLIDNGVLIKTFPKWTQENQTLITDEIIAMVTNGNDTEPLPENFEEICRSEPNDDFKMKMFEGMEDD
jgi:hypothetical protein